MERGAQTVLNSCIKTHFNLNFFKKYCFIFLKNNNN
jgi:hypothetical protein